MNDGSDPGKKTRLSRSAFRTDGAVPDSATDGEIELLIVDDEAFLRKQVKEIFTTRMPSAQVNEAFDEAGFWHVVTHRQPKLVFMDIHIGGLNGLTLTRRLKESHPDIKVAVWSGNDSPEYREAAEDAGADYFVSKKTDSVHRLLRLAERIADNGGSRSNPVQDQFST